MSNVVREITVKSVLNKHKKRDSWFLDDYSLNPYKNCQFNCTYCYIHGSKYGEHIPQEVCVKVNAPRVLYRELRRRSMRNKYGFIAVSSSTEAWMPIEEKYEVTRRCLEVVSRFSFPVHCGTKSTLILRDVDLLHEISQNAVLPSDLRDKLKDGVLITISLSTIDEDTAKIFEPNAPPPKERLKLLWRLREEGFQAGIAYIPVLPFISDSSEKLEEMIKTAKEYDASYVFVGSLTLFGAGKKNFYRLLEKRFPELLLKYKSLFRIFTQPSKEYQEKLNRLARKLCEKHKVQYRIV